MAEEGLELTEDEFNAQVQALSEKILGLITGTRNDVVGNALAEVLAAHCATCEEPGEMFAAMTCVFAESYSDMRDTTPGKPESKN